MDTAKYFRAKKRMVKYGYDCTIACEKCPLFSNNNGTGLGCEDLQYEQPETAVEIVEKWVEENPPQTRQQKLLEVFPGARVIGSGIIDICPMAMNKRFVCQLPNCGECRKRFWLEEVEDEK